MFSIRLCLCMCSQASITFIHVKETVGHAAACWTCLQHSSRLTRNQTGKYSVNSDDLSLGHDCRDRTVPLAHPVCFARLMAVMNTCMQT